MRTCEVEGCTRTAVRPGRCETHRKQERRGKSPGPIREYGLRPLERVTRASLRHADAEGDDEYRRAKDLLRKYADAYGKRRRAENVPKRKDTLSHGKGEGSDPGR